MASITGTSASELLVATSSDGDVIEAYGGSDTLVGGDGGDTLYDGSTWSPYGAPDADILIGGSGNDLLDTDGGFDILIGGSGNDRLDVSDYWDLQGTTNNGVQGIYDGGSGTDVLYIYDTADISAVILSRIEILETSTGQFSDQIVTATAAQFDSFDVIRNGDLGDNVRLAIKAVGANTTLDLVTQLNTEGTARNAVIIGSHDNEVIRTGDGADQLSGAIGSDRLFGNNGADQLSGGDGNDRLFGGRDADTIDGGAGNDIIRGGAGADTFVFADGSGNDTIIGFGASNKEDIDLSAVSGIAGFHDLVNHHLVEDVSTHFAMIVDGSDSILLKGVAVSDIGSGLAYSGADFIF